MTFIASEFENANTNSDTDAQLAQAITDDSGPTMVATKRAV
ncbi:hypothetical protein B0I08_101390 [Glaciihabitans tibetensis]|uniref:Uncharacterized protein n=1 Tax=Glaciihabitans tibetensis TaxID=1266600 RepID=A0A2T0VJ68_9MICO|nr:hypothetical protein [Glaciihabitans tibetensis]PRY70260.1 hypothetical protein B0I08_101390 [Glaciihabitans tibetensis]